ncbi:NtaA/DmoA family FMN-dependent monooxygenase [Nocardia sp. NPDC050378]|uniref:NtaA/DmoA family FMN-dependent monooxygenase n=1 Tax=Nocardia sp. NPDC050378 TaxID=3155400 RepID=UPI0033D36B04
MTQPTPLRFGLYTCFAPGGPLGTAWHHPGNLDFNYLDLDHQTKLAKALEAAKFDLIFWADFSGVHDTYQSSYNVAVRDAVAFPLGDPLVLTAALAGATENLGLAFSANMTQQNPYNFARRVATLDHLTKGRISWNIVTSYQPSAWRNAGFDDMEGHSTRYVRAQEYVDVVRKLLVESWEDKAVVRDVERKVYADPALVHPIEHEGTYYRVPGIGLSEPSPQRMPVTLQAGSSGDGRNFSARNAEAMFIGTDSPDGAAKMISDMTRRLEENGRSRSDMLFLQYFNVVLASTEEEAKRKNEELDEQLISEGNIAFTSSSMGTDLSQIDIDKPFADFKTESMQGILKGFIESAPDKSWTFRDMVRKLGSDRVVGTPEQIADELEKWRDVGGVDGINLNGQDVQNTYDFLEHAVPVLQERGLMQREYRSGTLRDKLFRR